MSSSSSSLVLGFAARLPPALIEPFVDSLRATSYRGRIGLILAQYGEPELREFESLADFTVNVDRHYAAPLSRSLLRALTWVRTTRRVRRAYPWMFMLCAAAGREREALTRWENLEFALEGLQSLRYKHYHEVLQTVATDATHVLLTDVRDVLFQSDPFGLPVERLELFLEDASQTVGSEPFNRRWIRELYGPSILSSMRDLTVSCSGTVLGPRDDVLHYLRQMQDQIVWRRRPLGSHDQGVHNFLVRSGRLERAVVVPNGCGRILTMGHMTDVRLGVDGVVLNDDETVPAVLHQYDRHPALARQLVAKLASFGIGRPIRDG